MRKTLSILAFLWFFLSSKSLSCHIHILGEAPQKGEEFHSVMADVESKIMPGVVHWNHPRFFAYFPSGNSYPSILGDMLSSAIGSIGFSWVCAIC